MAPVWAVFSLFILWLGVIAGSVYEDGMNLFQFMSLFSEALSRPFAVSFTSYTLKFMAGFLFLYVCAIGLYYSNRQNRRPGEEHGSAKWGNVRQLNKKYADKNPHNNAILTQNLRMSLNPRQHMRNLLQIIVGGSGASKTRGVVLPNVLEANASFIVTDPKGEITRKVAPFLLQHGYVVRVFDLIDPTHSDCYNPFHYIRQDSDVFRLINNFIQNTTPKNAKRIAHGSFMNIQNNIENIAPVILKQSQNIIDNIPKQIIISNIFVLLSLSKQMYTLSTYRLLLHVPCSQQLQATP